MAKPICVIKIDMEVDFGSRQERINLYEMQVAMEARFPDYHVFTIPQGFNPEPHDPIQLQVFYEKDFTEIQYAELKQLIEESIKQPQKPAENA